MKQSLLIKSVRLIDPANGIDQITNVQVKQGKITAIGKELHASSVDQIIDAKGLWMLPGLIDLSVYLRELGQENKAAIANESRVAAESGITTICAMPEDNSPIDTSAKVNLLKEKARQADAARIEIIGNLFNSSDNTQLSNMGSLKNAGCVALSQGLGKIDNLDLLAKSMDYACSNKIMVFYQPIEHELMGHGCAHQGTIATRLGLPPISSAVESTAMAQMLMLVEETNIPVHFCRLSCAKSVELLDLAKRNNLPVTADVAAHQLFLTEMDISDFNTLCNTLPPLRSERDRQTLRQGLADGVIDAICSDHQPHDIDAKLSPFQQSSPGISALETLLPLTMRLVEEDVLSLSDALRCVSLNPASIINKQRGSLGVGDVADFCLYDTEKYQLISRDTLKSDGKNSPFFGWGFNGEVATTVINGKLVYSRD